MDVQTEELAAANIRAAGLAEEDEVAAELGGGAQEEAPAGRDGKRRGRKGASSKSSSSPARFTQRGVQREEYVAPIMSYLRWRSRMVSTSRAPARRHS